MFRTLALLIHINYLVLSDTNSTVLIDDIGEGLDYERSSNLISLLTNKAQNSKLQLIMTTNDKFVMNKVPLEYWSILIRDSNSVRIINKNNSPKVFEEFKYVGLNNFEFFESGYFVGKND